MILINGLPDNRITILDRGLQYGDGLFETMAFRAGTIEFIDAHFARLIEGCRRLNIKFTQADELNNELNTVCQSFDGNDAIVKVIITRGVGGRGYLATNDVEPTRIISTHPLPEYPTHYRQTGVKTRLCTHTLSENSVLAGIKHLNRLDQVLARNEWHDSDIVEGIMLDQVGKVIEGTMSNVFMVKEGKLLTPMLDRSGVAGIMRAQTIFLANELNIPVIETHIHIGDFMMADEIFITNSIIGIWPVSVMDNTSFLVGSITQNLQYALQQAKK